MAVSAATPWGDEVMPGVYVIRRAHPNSAAAELQRAGERAAVDPSAVHEAIADAERLIERLRDSNREIDAFVMADRAQWLERRRLLRAARRHANERAVAAEDDDAASPPAGDTAPSDGAASESDSSAGDSGCGSSLGDEDAAAAGGGGCMSMDALRGEAFAAEARQGAKAPAANPLAVAAAGPDADDTAEYEPDREFAAALVENAMIIRAKLAEVRDLTKLIAGQTCGCHASHRRVPLAEAADVPVSAPAAAMLPEPEQPVPIAGTPPPVGEPKTLAL